MGVTIKIENNSNLVREELELAVKRALTKCGLQAQTFSKSLCPVDTGNLRNSISYEVNDNTVYIGTNVEYAPYVELGTYKMTARPYLEPALSGYIGTYESIIKSELGGTG